MAVAIGVIPPGAPKLPDSTRVVIKDGFQMPHPVVEQKGWYQDDDRTTFPRLGKHPADSKRSTQSFPRATLIGDQRARSLERPYARIVKPISCQQVSNEELMRVGSESCEVEPLCERPSRQRDKTFTERFDPYRFFVRDSIRIHPLSQAPMLLRFRVQPEVAKATPAIGLKSCRYRPRSTLNKAKSRVYCIEKELY